ncbi:MAG: threonine/serine exporter family protein [Chloroflexi bacterium]|nr:threonine/serine exporter family protein [Chloroflexota bacterium]
MNLLTLIPEILQDALWSGLAALGFAMLFNVPRHLLLACVLFGALGHATRTLLMGFGLAIEPATLIGATIVGFAGTYWANRLHIPSMIFTVTGAIPLVPGAFAYRAMIGILSVVSATPENGGDILVEASTNAIKTALLLLAIALGIAWPLLLFQRPKPVV